MHTESDNFALILLSLCNFVFVFCETYASWQQSLQVLDLFVWNMIYPCWENGEDITN